MLERGQVSEVKRRRAKGKTRYGYNREDKGKLKGRDKEGEKRP